MAAAGAENGSRSAAGELISFAREATMPEVRLGDVIDDYCVRCKRIMNHSVVSVLNGEPAKVRCRTCHSDHDYRHEQAPPPKSDPRKAALFDQVLSNITGPTAAGEAPAEAAAEGRKAKRARKPK